LKTNLFGADICCTLLKDIVHADYRLNFQVKAKNWTGKGNDSIQWRVLCEDMKHWPKAWQ